MDSPTIASQRETELILLRFLKRYNPDVYALWRLHPDYEGDDAEDSSAPPTRQSDDDDWEDVPPNNNINNDDARGDPLVFYRRKHMDYLMDSKLANVLSSSQGLYPAQPWLAYWALQAADVLGITSQLLARVPREGIIEKLISCLSSVGQEEERRAREGPTPLVAAAAAPQSHVHLDASSHTARVMARATAFPTPSPVDLSRPCISFSGGAMCQMPHMATSYAACCALAILTDDNSSNSNNNNTQRGVQGPGVPLSSSAISPALLRTLPRAAIKRWLLSVRNEDGSFRMHWGGESDIRASYCGAVVTHLLRLDEPDTFGALEDAVANGEDDVSTTPVLTPQTALFVSRCQTHEGGFACGAYASEAHGAYTQCGLAALLLMDSPHLCDHASLRRWLTARQLAYEGGFNGRTNKLVDSCYCHWVGAAHVLLRVAEIASKARGYHHAQAIVGDAEAPLTAREVCLLHHAQLLDARGIACEDTAAWAREETRVLSEADTTDFFLDASDGVKRRAAKKRQARRHFCAQIAPSKSAAVVTEEAADEAFYAAEVGDYYFNQRRLQLYVLACCQSKEKGGLMDKPDTAHDTYHTCYSLSGTTQAQNLHYASLLSSGTTLSPYLDEALAKGYLPKSKSKEQEQADSAAEGSYGVVLGIRGASTAADISMLRIVNPIFNLHPRRVVSALSAFGPKTFV